MAKVVEVPNVGNVEFPDAMGDSEISAAIRKTAGAVASDPAQAHAAPPGAWDTVKQAAGTAGDFLGRTAGDTLQGVGSGVVSTGLGAYDLARKIPGADKVLPEPSQDLRSASQPPNSLAGRAGKYAEQAAEFLVPSTVIGKLFKAAEAAKAAQAAAAGVQMGSRFLPTAARIAAESAAAGGTAAVQSGGNMNDAAAAALTTGGLGAAGAVIPEAAKAAVLKLLSSGVRPLSAGARNLAAKYGIPLTQGSLTGSRTAQGVEKLLGRSVAPDLYEPLIEKGQQGLSDAAADLSGGFATDKFSAGHGVMQTMLGKAKDLTDTAQKEYESLAALEAEPANSRSVPVGTKPNMSLDPTQPDRVPAMQSMGLPVDMRDTKQALAPLESEISRRMTPAQRRADPGLSAIQNILSRPDYLPASVAEGDLSYLKNILRSDASGQAKRLAGAAIDSLDRGVQDAVGQAGPGAVDSLTNARAAWKSRSDILDTLKSLAGDPSGQVGQVRLANTLLRPLDASYPALQKVLAVAPAAAHDLGQAYLTDRVFKAAADGADVAPKTAAKLWNQIGPRTKAALYPPEVIKNVDSFMEVAKRLGENPNPSDTGSMNALLKLGALVVHPVQGAIALGFGRKLAKVLYDPAGGAALVTMLKGPGTVEAGKAINVVRSLLDARETSPGKPEPAAP